MAVCMQKFKRQGDEHFWRMQNAWGRLLQSEQQAQLSHRQHRRQVSCLWWKLNEARKTWESLPHKT
eukprot:1168838-Pyramimonas_sp.AAC.1